MDWIMGMQKAIDYIKGHLTEEIDYDIVAAQSFSSSYHFQRVFSILCGFTVGEYIHNNSNSFRWLFKTPSFCNLLISADRPLRSTPR